MTVVIRKYAVGGTVRDHLLGLEPKDYDYAVEAPSFEAMRKHLLAEGFRIFVEKPEFLTIRAQFPRTQRRPITGDFVLCRRDGSYGDGRRPDRVVPGSIFDDLARRDFTINAMAMMVDQPVLIDPHGGQDDIRLRRLRCVGSTEQRLREDSLRALRALRFRVVKGMEWDQELHEAMCSDWLPALLANVSTERRREELTMCFAHDTLGTMEILQHEVSVEFCQAAFAGGIRLRPTMREHLRP